MEVKKSILENACAAFIKDAVIEEIENIPNGHINVTDRVKVNGRNYILQKINTNIFRDPVGLIGNISSVTEFLREKIIASGGDPDRETLHFLKTLDGKLYYTDEDGSCWRSYVYVDDCYTLGSNCSLDEIYEAAKAFGHFQYMLGDFPGNKLFEIIDGFHHTPTRMERLKKAIAEDKVGRVCEAQEEINCLLEREKNCSVVTDLLAKGEIPVRVTHNDTKINNILFDAVTGKAVAVIDLDTVMPSFIFSDYGDFLRTAANKVAEDCPEIDKVEFDVEIFKAFTKGYLESASSFLTPVEKENLPYAVALFPFMQAVRFFADYVNGDTYYKIAYPEHNLVRTRNQMALFRSVMAHKAEMEAYIATL